jgi:hypothetical protein
VGDCVVELGPDTAAAGAKVSVEAKEKAGYDLAQARQEIETARKNRDAQVGLFVFSRKTAPENLEPLARYGQDVIVVWDREDPTSDLFLRTGLTLARALCVRSTKQRASQEADFDALETAILEIEKRTAALGEVETWATTIHKRSDDILKKMRTSRASLEKQTTLLRQRIEDLQHHMANESDGEAATI